MKKVELLDTILTIVDVESDFSDQIIPAGSLGTVVECYEPPPCYAVDLVMPDETLVGGVAYSNVILTPAQFLVLSDEKLLHSINGHHDSHHYASQEKSQAPRTLSATSLVASIAVTADEAEGVPHIYDGKEPNDKGALVHASGPPSIKPDDKLEGVITAPDKSGT